MMDIDEAAKQCIRDIKLSICQFPECGQEYGAQAFGVFNLWLKLVGYRDDDENEIIAVMREYCLRAVRYGSSEQKKFEAMHG